MKTHLTIALDASRRPKVLALASELKTDPARAFGLCVIALSWIVQHGEDAASDSTIDMMTCEGFSSALKSVGLIASDDYSELSNCLERSESKKIVRRPSGIPPIPDELNTPEFAEMWSEWLAYRREKKAAVTNRSAVMVFNEAVKHGPEAAVEALKRSIFNGWTGVFFDQAKAKHSEVKSRVATAEDLKRWNPVDGGLGATA